MSEALPAAAPPPPLTSRRVLATWWPLALSWLLMAVELPLVAALIARRPEPEIGLAAFGGIVLPLALLIESPVIMFLGASTALSRDGASYRRLRRYAHTAGVSLTLVHAAVVFTPLFDFVAGRLFHAPREVWEPARLGLRFMLPWTWAIAYRRFHQGVLIRHGHSRAVALGTAIRLASNVTALAVLSALGLPGTAVAGGGLATAVLAEAVYAGRRARPVVRDQVDAAPPVEPPLDLGAFLSFYLPLGLTSLLDLLMEPFGAACIGRMPRPLESLAVWPVVIGLVFVYSSMGIAYNEVVVALAAEPGAIRTLRRFVLGLMACLSGLFLVLVATPLSWVWLLGVTALDPELARLARGALWLALPLPPLIAACAFYQGVLVHRARTRGIPESMVIFLLTAATVAVSGVAWGRLEGVHVTLAALVAGTVLQLAWLRFRAREPLAELEAARERA